MKIISILLGVAVSFVFSAPNGMGSDPTPIIRHASTHHLKNNSSASAVEGNSTISEGLHLTGMNSNNSITVEFNNQTIQATKSDSQQTKNGAQLVKEKESVKSEFETSPIVNSTDKAIVIQSHLEMNIDNKKEPSSNASEKNANLAASKSDENNQQEKMKKTTTEISKPQEQNVITLSRKVIQAFASLLNLGDAEHVIVKDLKKHKFTCLAFETKNQMNVIMEQCEARWHPESNLANAVVNNTQVQGKGHHPQFSEHLGKNVNKEGRKNDIISKNDFKKKAIERKEKSNTENGLMIKTPKNSDEKSNQSKNNKNHTGTLDENMGKYFKQLKNIQDILNIGKEVAKFLNDGSDDEESNDSFVNQPPSKKTGKTNAANHRFEDGTQGFETNVAAKKTNGKKKHVEDDNIQVSVETNEENPTSNRNNKNKKSRKNKGEVSQTLSTANEETADDFETVQPTKNKKKKKSNKAVKNRKGSPNENDYDVDQVPYRGIGQQDKSISFRKRAVDNQPKQENLHMHETKLALCFLTSMMGNIDNNRSSVDQLRKEIERSDLLLDKKNLAIRDYEFCVTDFSTKEHNNFFHLLKEVGCFVKALGQNGCGDNRNTTTGN